MSDKVFKTIDGNEAAAYVAYRLNEVIAIYPITPSSNMGEWADQWASENKVNLWGTIPSVVEMQSEGGAAGAVHGALQAGSLSTTFTASQGLLLMIPNMFKIAGELTPAVFHIAARTLAAHALSIFGDHSDVMSARSTGFAMLSSSSVQEVMDFALISQAATLESRIPFVHFFDGFRTSHEVAKIEMLSEDQMRAMIDDELIKAHRQRALTPDLPVIRGTAQNPDVFFQARETVNTFYNACPDTVQKVMDKFAKVSGRSYKLFEYYGAPDADRVVVVMGSGAETVGETVKALVAKGEKVGMVKVNLYRPLDVKRFVEVLPKTLQKIAVLDRTKEPGAAGEPMYLDVIAALHEGTANGWCKFSPYPSVYGGRYGLSSKEFTPAMVKAVFDNLSSKQPKNHFTVGITDDVTHTSLAYDASFSVEGSDVFRALFYGLGSDGTVGANKNTIKIIGENTDNYAQGYFVYDSKKSGSITISHVRFGKSPIRSPYLISQADFIGCHHEVFLEQLDVLKMIRAGGTFLLNTQIPMDQVWDSLPRIAQQQILDKKVKFYAIDAYKVAREAGMGRITNTIMQTCFFAISNVLPREQAIEQIKKAIKKTYGRKGEEVVKKNLDAVDQSINALHEIKLDGKKAGTKELKAPVPANATAFEKQTIGAIIAGLGDDLPVSAMPIDGTFPTATTQLEKRNLALDIPAWDPAICIQCSKCVTVCPHAVIRSKIYDDAALAKAPASFKSKKAMDRNFAGMNYTIQVAAEDCTGCGVCVDVCPAKNKADLTKKAINMTAQPPIREQEKKNWEFFLSIPDVDRKKISTASLRTQQLQRPLFEFSGACAGCGETPYIKMASQLFGDRMLIANATGCTSIYGGNLPTTPYCKDANGRGPAWSNSLFEDNAEFGLGFRLAVDKKREYAVELLKKVAGHVGEDLVRTLTDAVQKTEADIYEQRERVAALKSKLATMDSPEAKQLIQMADYLVKKSVWIFGGDGWAYDIGFGGLDHVLASGRNVNILVMDTEVYSNTGGQMSKSTPRGAVAKFAMGGKPGLKKDLGLIAMSYGNVYVAKIALGAKDEQTLKAFIEAEAHDGPSIIIAYSHCIAHGINMELGFHNQKAAVDSGQWILYRYNPARALKGENPLQLDSAAPTIPVEKYLYAENRFKMLLKTRPEEAKALAIQAQEDVKNQRKFYEYLAAQKYAPETPAAEPVKASV